MNAIVVVDKFWGIGKNNDLLFHLKADMKFFRQTTMGKVIVMGSNTLKSFPEGKPLPGRTNVVLFPDGEKRSDCIVCDSLNELREALRPFDSDNIFIVGGAMFYKTMLPFCQTVYVTKVDADGQAIVFYENLDSHTDWDCTKEGVTVSDGDYTITFNEYKNKNPQDFFGGKHE